jgi:dimethylargininase
MARLTHAIVRSPNTNFAYGLTTATTGTPNYDRAVEQHRAYCEALTACGLDLTRLPPDERYPDSTFIEDTAVVTPRGVIITRPGAQSRLGEVDSVDQVLRGFFSELRRIDAPGTLDAGDVCEAGDHFFIGVSKRTNEAGAKQLATFLGDWNYTASLIDIRDLSNILHLKSGLAFLGSNQLVLIDDLAEKKQFQDYSIIRVPTGEEYAANCLLINDKVLVPADFPSFEKRIQDLGYRTFALEMSEFQKMDGGLSCLSLRF